MIPQKVGGKVYFPFEVFEASTEDGGFTETILWLHFCNPVAEVVYEHGAVVESDIFYVATELSTGGVWYKRRDPLRVTDGVYDWADFIPAPTAPLISPSADWAKVKEVRIIN